MKFSLNCSYAIVALIREIGIDDGIKKKGIINAEVEKKIRAEKKSILFKAVSSYIKTSESILDGVCEGKFPETPDMRSKETFVRGEGRKSNYYSPSKLESATEYVEGLHQRLKEDDVNEIKLKKQEETDDFNKMKKYNAGHKTPEEILEDKQIMELEKLVRGDDYDDETSIYGRRQR